VIYDELRCIGSRYVRRERDHGTLRATALANEAWLRLVDVRAVQWQNRAHFFALCAHIVGFLWISHAHAGLLRVVAACASVELDMALAECKGTSDLVAIDDAPQALSAIDPRKSAAQSKVVELRFFGGLPRGIRGNTSSVHGYDTARLEDREIVASA
jgi:RNA polymerase sigma-70 factor, ECF subfamily